MKLRKCWKQEENQYHKVGDITSNILKWIEEQEELPKMIQKETTLNSPGDSRFMDENIQKENIQKEGNNMDKNKNSCSISNRSAENIIIVEGYYADFYNIKRKCDKEEEK